MSGDPQAHRATHPGRKGWPIAVALALAVGLALLVFQRVDLRTDMADLLPSGRTAAARLMLEELRTSSTTSVILIGIEGAPAADLARISKATTRALDASGLFSFVNDGTTGIGAAEQGFLFDHRYLLSPVTSPAAFTTDALHQDFTKLLQGLASSAAPLVSRFGLPDPPGAFQAIAQAWIGGSHVRLQDGAWFAADRDRALILAKTRADGLDIAAQTRVAAAIKAAFRQAKPGQARLLQAGPAVFARDAAQAIQADVRLISIVSSLLIVALLLWRFRSPWVVAAIAVPVVLSVAAAAASVQLIFGFVHGVTLGFGITMLGVTVDYPVLLIGHRKRAEQAQGTLRRIGPTLMLAVTTAALGLTGMLFSGFPGLSQLGVFSVVGILVAAATTRLILPRLIVAADLAPVFAGDPAGLLRVERLRRYRAWGLLPVAAAAAYLVLIGGPRWEGELSHLSPVPAADQALFQQLSAEIGAPDVGQLIVVRAPSAEAVLHREEALLPELDRLVARGVISGMEAAARYLPSQAVQLARRAALPDATTLAARVRAASAGLPFRATAFDAFQQAVEASRHMRPVVLADITSPLIAARLGPLLFRRDGGWVGVIAPQGVADPRRLAAAMAGQPGVTYVDMKAESDAMVAFYAARAWRWLALGGLAALLALAIGLRDAGRVARVLGAVAAAALVSVALLTAAGVRLSLIHVVALQLVAGLGLDYALFFARRQLDEEERARTLRTLVTCNAMTLLSFGLLALCRTPLLREIGETVALGALAAMCFAFLFVGPRPTLSR